jgi:hypothetical protein
MVSTVARDVAFRYAAVDFATCPAKNRRPNSPSPKVPLGADPVCEHHEVGHLDEPAQAVARYLGSLQSQWRRRRMRLTREAILSRLEALRCQLPAARSVARLNLVQKRRDLEADLRVLETSPSLQHLEEDFVAVAAAYGRREGLSYSDWRRMGVARLVLCQAGIGPGETETPAP